MPLENNGLGAARVAAGHPVQGVPYLQSALETRPDYFEAHYNLGFARAGQEDFEGAAEQFRLASRLQPEDANVEANLGAARAQAGRYLEAKSHFERALQIEPNQPIAKENLEALQKEMNSHASNCSSLFRFSTSRFPTTICHSERGGAPVVCWYRQTAGCSSLRSPECQGPFDFDLL